MHDFAILTNRKRARIALIHSVIFWLVALRGAAAARVLTPIWTKNPVPAPTLLLVGIYLIVATVLAQLVRASRCTREKLYFGFCATSASIGLLRYLFGDPALHAGLYLRVLLLTCAVVTGTMIMLRHPRETAAALGTTTEPSLQ